MYAQKESPDFERLAMAAGRVRNLSVESVLRKDLDVAGFSDSELLIQRSFHCLQMLDGLNFYGAPVALVTAAMSAAEEVSSFLLGMAEWKVVGALGAPVKERDKWVSELSQACEELANNMPALLVFGVRNAQIETDPERLAVQIQQLHHDANREVSAIVENMKKAAGVTGVAAQARHFQAARDASRRGATGWLVATVVLASLTALYAASVIWQWTPQLPSNAGAGDITRYLFARVLAASFLLAAVTWTAKNFKAHRHNEVVNNHRTTALQTFQVFVSATTDPHVRDAVLLQAAQGIFAAQASGYLGDDTEPLPQATIVEVLRKVGEPK